MKQFLNWSLDREEYGNVVDMSEFTSGGQNLLTFVTTKGRLCGLDLRAPGLAWDLQNNNKHGQHVDIVSVALARASGTRCNSYDSENTLSCNSQCTHI